MALRRKCDALWIQYMCEREAQAQKDGEEVPPVLKRVKWHIRNHCPLCHKFSRTIEDVPAVLVPESFATARDVYKRVRVIMCETCSLYQRDEGKTDVKPLWKEDLDEFIRVVLSVHQCE